MSINTLYSFEISDKSADKQILYVNELQTEQFQLEPNQTLTLQIGTYKINVQVEMQAINQSLQTLYISKSVADALPYFLSQPLNIVFSSDKILVFGSTFGMIVPKETLARIDKASTIKKRAQLALQKGVLFFCCQWNGIDWKNNSIIGYALHPLSKQWIRQRVAIPDVLYYRGNALPSVPLDYSQHNRPKGGIQWINSARALGQWETYKAIQRKAETSNLMPKTSLLSLTSLETFLNKYTSCYVKGNFGKSGSKVFRINKINNRLLCSSGGSIVKRISFKTLQLLYKYLQKTLGPSALVQQEIALEKINNGPFDMRILMQKDGNGIWQISAVNFRIAKPGAIVTNFSAGAADRMLLPGEQLPVTDLSWKTIEDFSKKCVTALESTFGPMGEIGLDAGLDKKHRLWMIEANSRPNMIAYRNATSTGKANILGLPLDYSKYMTHNQHIHQNSK